jgi:hypothetical protein
MGEEKIWYKDPIGFVKIDKLADFIPLQSMSFAERLNAIMRFVLYFTLLLLVVQGDPRVLYIPVFFGLFTLGMYSFYDKDKREFYSRHSNHNLKYDKRRKEACSLPTKNNPFGNILVSDYQENPRRPPGCRITKTKMKSKVEKLFGHNLYRDIDDIWHRNSSSRNFYQTPIQTIPNKQTEFAEWLYGRNRTCKQGSGEQCIKNQM